MNYQTAGTHPDNAIPDDILSEERHIVSRKVARSGHISYDGHPYFVSKNLAGCYVRLVIIKDRLIIDTSIPLHKEYTL